jgi:tRNA pseudouridine38-40 synthase
VAHFDTSSPIGESSNGPPPEQWIFKLNRFLPPDITVLGMKEVSEKMHARFSAISRTYHYHISMVKPLFDRRYTLYHYGALDTEKIRECCKVILETKDFTSFSKLHTDVKTNLCHVIRADWISLEHGYRFEIQSDRFLRNMVRSLVGTLLEVGKGRIGVEGFSEIVEARDRTRAGQSAPAKGLFLVDVSYAVD